MKLNVLGNLAPAMRRLLGALLVLSWPEERDPSWVLFRNKGVLKVAIRSVKVSPGRILRASRLLQWVLGERRLLGRALQKARTPTHGESFDLFHNERRARSFWAFLKIVEEKLPALKPTRRHVWHRRQPRDR